MTYIFNEGRTFLSKNSSIQKSSAPEKSVIQKTANMGGNMGGSGSRTMYSAPSFYSPVHTPVNWQIPTKRKEVYMWARFFSQNDPTIASSLRFYSQFPFSGFDNVIDHEIRKEHFDDLKKRLQIESKWLPLIAYEYFSLGDVFPFISISCSHCGGFGTDKNGQPCSHPGGSIANITILNPDWVEVTPNPLMPVDPVLKLIPDDSLYKIVWSNKPPEIAARIPDHLKKLILAKQPIPLSNKCVTHMKHDEIAYQPYGRSLLAPLFPILAYQDKLRQAQWIVAERHILPIKIAKVGNDQRPAGPQDIADVQQQLALTANDPNLTLVTHHAFEFKWEGSSGKVLQLSKEYELVDKALIKGLGVNEALLSGTGPSYCFDEKTRILTHRGFISKDEFDLQNDLVATYNKVTGALEYQKAQNKYEFDHDSINGDDKDLYYFKTNRVDFMCTHNHRMLVKSHINYNRKIDKWDVIPAEEVEKGMHFKASVDLWEGVIPNDINDLCLGIPIQTFLELSGIFVSEGCFFKNNRGYNKDNNYEFNGKIRSNAPKIGICYTQNIDNTAHSVCLNIFDNIKGFKKTCDKRKLKSGKIQERFIIWGQSITKKFEEYFSEYAENKKIPIWIKNLPSQYLKVFLDSICKGDGSERAATKKKKTSKKYMTYNTTSSQLRDDIMEILIKLGYSPRFNSSEGDTENSELKWVIYWSPDTNIGKTPRLSKQNLKTNKYEKSIIRVPYKGKVWCIKVPNSFFISERNGLISVNGNSQAAIGIEATIRRLRTVQNIIGEWICEKIYKLEAQMRGFYKKDKRGNDVLDYPTIRWNDLNLRDESQKNNLYMQLWDKGIISTQFLCEKLNIDYETETMRVRLEQALQQQLGIAPQGKKGKGGFGGLGGGFGGGGGGGSMPGGDDLGGNMPGGGSAPGLPGDEFAPSMSGGEGSTGAPSGGPAMGSYETQLKNYNQALDVAPKVHSPNKFKLHEPRKPIQPKPIAPPEEQLYEGPRTGLFRLTSLEQKLYAAVMSAQKEGNLPMDFVMQQKPEPINMPRVTVDGMFPSLKLIIEADGERWHAAPDDLARDGERDAELNSYGWQIIRFTDEQIEHQIEDVLATIIQTVQDIMKNKQGQYGQ